MGGVEREHRERERGKGESDKREQKSKGGKGGGKKKKGSAGWRLLYASFLLSRLPSSTHSYLSII